MSDWLTDVVKARFAVASLGERIDPPWWRSSATSAVGKRMLQRLFPRTYMVASLEAASRAAGIEHDSRIGTMSSYHLFRLPAGVEVALYEALMDPARAGSLYGLSDLESMEQLYDALAGLARGTRGLDGEGPVRLETDDDLRDESALRTICATYLRAFQTRQRAYPYFVSQSEG